MSTAKLSGHLHESRNGWTRTVPIELFVSEDSAEKMFRYVEENGPYAVVTLNVTTLDWRGDE